MPKSSSIHLAILVEHRLVTVRRRHTVTQTHGQSICCDSIATPWRRKNKTKHTVKSKEIKIKSSQKKINSNSALKRQTAAASVVSGARHGCSSHVPRSPICRLSITTLIRLYGGSSDRDLSTDTATELSNDTVSVLG